MIENENTSLLVEPTRIERDLAQSAFYDSNFAVWFSQFAKPDVLYYGAMGASFFNECGMFAKRHKKAMGDVGDAPATLFENAISLQWFKTLNFAKLPGEAKHKPTAWQMEKARKYLNSRHNILLSEKLADAEAVRQTGDPIRADLIASEARRTHAEFKDHSTPCRRALDDEDALLKLAEHTPPLFYLDGEMGRMLNHRLKGDNFGILLANQKVGKTTTLLNIAIQAAKYTPTLFISAGDETELKINGRILTNISCCATQPDFAGTYSVPVPDCAHNAMGTCPIGMGGVPRVEKDWKNLLECGAKPEQLVNGDFDGSRTINGDLYQPCCRCFPMNDGTPEDREKRKRWKSAVWWRNETFPLVDMKKIKESKQEFRRQCGRNGLWIAEYSAGKLTPEIIEEKLDSLDRTENVTPMVVVIDYFDLMKQPSLRNSDKDHDGMRMNYESLRALTFNRNILIITATQTNRNDLETHTIHSIGRCAKGADNCTWFLTLNQTVLEKRAKVMRASMLFAREGGFDAEHQALCCQWLEAQDSFAFSMPYFCKIKTEKGNQ